jgi:hypothetical protein
MDLVFLISGLSLALLCGGAARREGLLRQRSWRLLVPLVFGMAAIVPYQAYAQAVANGAVQPGFGAFLLRYFTGGPWPKDAIDGFTGLRGLRLALLPALPLLLYSLLLWPHFPPTRDLVGDGWLHAVYFTLFLYGYWIGVDTGWWAEVARLRKPMLAAAPAGRPVPVGDARGHPRMGPCLAGPPLALAGLGQRIRLSLVRAAPDGDHRARRVACAAGAGPGAGACAAGDGHAGRLLAADCPDPPQRLATPAVRPQAASAASMSFASDWGASWGA